MAEAPTDTGTEKYEAFLVHSSEDEPIARQINEGLNSKGLTTFANYAEGQAFKLGKPTVDSIIELVKISDRVLILLTPNAIKSSWVSLEILLGLEKSHIQDQMCMRLLLYNITEEQRKTFPDLEHIPFIKLDFNRDNWTDSLFDQVVAKIRENVPMTAILPAGNVAHGLVFNYFCGFLQHILPVLKARIERSETYQQHKDRMLTQFYILLPESSRVNKIDGEFGSFVIKIEECLKVQSGHGDITRSYSTTVFSITSKDDDETYWFIGECPTIMDTMAKLAESDYVEKFDKKMQVVRFSKTLEDFVNHKQNADYNDTVAFVVYDDENTTHAEQLWRRIKDLPQTQTTVHNITRNVGKLPTEKTTVCKYFATVTNSQDDDEDKKVATEVMDFLTSKQVAFTNGEETMSSDFLRDARWNIFVISAQSVKDPKMQLQYKAAIHESIADNEVQVIPILTKETRIEDIPQKYIWATVLQSSQPNYLELLWRTLEGKNRKMQELWPAGKIYEGLAWAYMLNYLPIALLGQTADGRGFKERFEDAMVKYNTGCNCVPRVFLIVPKTCKIPKPGPFFVGETLVGPIEPAVIGFRKYFLQLYQITLENGKNVCYAREYATPAITLNEMQKFPSAGLNHEDMYKQSAAFADFVKTIINGDGFKKDVGDITEKCTVVYFDDETLDKQGMTNLLKSELSQCLTKGDFIAAAIAPEAAPT